jgi:hypothetical protein
MSWKLIESTPILNDMFKDEIKKIKSGLCPLCGTPVNESSFADQINIREYRISGMCKGCQDEMWKDIKYASTR